MEFILGWANAAIVLIPNENALTKLAKGHQADETLVLRFHVNWTNALHRLLWRGSLLPLGCVAVANSG
jgi:hypothetical protein